MPHSMILIDYCVFQQNESFVSGIFSLIGWSFSQLRLWHPRVMRGSSSGSHCVSHTWHERYAPWVCSSSRDVRKSGVSDCARAAEACWMQSWLQSARASRLLSDTCARGAVTIRVGSKNPGGSCSNGSIQIKLQPYNIHSSVFYCFCLTRLRGWWSLSQLP